LNWRSSIVLTRHLRCHAPAVDIGPLNGPSVDDSTFRVDIKIATRRPRIAIRQKGTARCVQDEAGEEYRMSELVPAVSKRDHILGPLDAPIVLVEYGDYQCPHCKAAYPNVKAIQVELGDRLCFAYRHFPLIEIHPLAEPAAEAAEAADAQGRFWEMHDMLFLHSPALDLAHLVTFATKIGLGMDLFLRELRSHHYLPRVQADLASGVRSGVYGTPTFFINGIRHQGGYDLESLLDALRVAP
jgi:protein-disulfide isomerase